MAKGNKLKMCLKILAAGAAFFLFFAFIYKIYRDYQYDYSGVPDAVSSSVSGTEYRLIVTANAQRIEDEDAFAKEILQMCRENSFQSLKLSTDVTGWPTVLNVTVYLHRSDVGKKEPEMRISFVPPGREEAYDIGHDAEKYRIIIE